MCHGNDVHKFVQRSDALKDWSATLCADTSALRGVWVASLDGGDPLGPCSAPREIAAAGLPRGRMLLRWNHEFSKNQSYADCRNETRFVTHQYVVFRDDQAAETSSQRSVTLDGLTPGIQYRLQVAAANLIYDVNPAGTQPCPARTSVGIRSAAIVVHVSCPLGSYAANRQEPCETCPAGTWSNSSNATAQRDCHGCPHGRWSNTLGANSLFACVACPAGKYHTMDGATSSSSCRPCTLLGHKCSEGRVSICPAGSHSTTSLDACPHCDDGSYSFRAAQTACSQCSRLLECRDGQLRPKQNVWWKAPVTSMDQFKACARTGVCIVNRSRPSVRCLEGYSGKLCQECSAGWTLTDQTWCTDCSQIRVVWRMASAIGIFACFALTVTAIMGNTLYRARLNGPSLEQEERNERVTLAALKIGYSFLQMSSFLRCFDLDWRSAVSKLMRWAGVVTSGMHTAVSSCIVPMTVYQSYCALLCSLPLALLGVWCGLKVRARASPTPNSVLFQHSVVAAWKCVAVTLLYLVHPLVFRHSVQMFHCREIEGRSWLVSDISVPCDGALHRYVESMAWAVITLYGVMFPAWLLYSMYRQRTELTLRRVRMSLGVTYLCYGYNDSVRWCWEIYSLTRRVLIVLVGEYLLGVPQLATANIIGLASALLQIQCKPFRKASQNRMELCSVCATQATLSLSWFLLRGDPSVDAPPSVGIGTVVSALIVAVQVGTCIFILRHGLQHVRFNCRASVHTSIKELMYRSMPSDRPA